MIALSAKTGRASTLDGVARARRRPAQARDGNRGAAPRVAELEAELETRVGARPLTRD